MKKPTKPAFLLALTATLSAHGAFGQTVSCDDCTHVASVYMGEGGVIATADGAEKVTWVAACGGVTRSGELAANADGKVTSLFSMDNGLACMAEKGGSFEIGPVKDGGWFWITDDMNSAVGGLVAKDVLKNDAADIASAGSGVTMTKGKGAVFLREAASGRVGILPDILPEPPVDALRKCGYTGAGTAASPYKVLNADCALGDGGAQLIATTTDPLTGKTVVIPDGGTVTRPAGTGRVDIVVDLLGNGSGHFRAHANPTGNQVILGQPDFVTTAAGTVPDSKRRHARLAITDGSTVKVGSGPRAVEIEDGVPGHASGVAWDSTQAPDGFFISIRAATAYCGKTANHPLVVSVSAFMTLLASELVIPNVRRTGPMNQGRLAAAMSFTIVCPPAAP